MTTRTIYTTAFPDPATKPADLIPAQIIMGHVTVLISKALVLTTDAAGSKIYFGKVPSDGIPLPEMCSIGHEALGNLTVLDIGEANNDDAILDAGNLSVAAVVAVTTIAPGDREKQFWEIFGYSADPGGELTIVGNITHAAAVQGNVSLTLAYAKM